MRVLALANQKGGCGKTTTAIHLAAALAQLGERVLLVDLDPQAHATLGLGRDASVATGPGTLEVLRGEADLAAASVSVPGGFELCPAQLELGAFEETAERSLGPERALDAALRASGAGWDRVVIDCPPRADGVLCANALRAADLLVLVVETGAFALQGALRASALFAERALELGRRPELRVLATLFDRRTRFAREVLVGMHARFGPLMFDTAIRTSVRLREAAAYGAPVQVLDPRARAAADFASLAHEVRSLGRDEALAAAAAPSRTAPSRTDPARGA